jgi:hypothetical protein
MPQPATPPVLHVRVVGPPALVDELTRTITAAVGRQLGPGTTCRHSTHPARRTGHIRRYITATRKETTDDPTA